MGEEELSQMPSEAAEEDREDEGTLISEREREDSKSVQLKSLSQRPGESDANRRG